MWRNKSEIEKLKAEVKSLCHNVYQHIDGIDSNIGSLISIIDHITVRELRSEIFSYLMQLSKSLCLSFREIDAMQCRLEEFEKNIDQYKNWFKIIYFPNGWDYNLDPDRSMIKCCGEQHAE